MARKPNYNFERMERERAKAAKKAARLEAKREKAEKKNTSNVELESNEPVPAASGSSRDSSEYEANKNEIPKPRAEKHFCERSVRRISRSV